MSRQFVIKRSCRVCGSEKFISHNKQESTNTLPVIDDRGRFVYQQKMDKKTGKMTEVQLTKTVKIIGLGTWKCGSDVCHGQTVAVR